MQCCCKKYTLIPRAPLLGRSHRARPFGERRVDRHHEAGAQQAQDVPALPAMDLSGQEAVQCTEDRAGARGHRYCLGIPFPEMCSRRQAVPFLPGRVPVRESSYVGFISAVHHTFIFGIRFQARSDLVVEGSFGHARVACARHEARQPPRRF